MPLRFVVTHLTGSPRRGLSEGDKVPISKFSADIVSSLRGVKRDTFTPCRIGVFLNLKAFTIARHLRSRKAVNDPKELLTRRLDSLLWRCGDA
jgi:hypothetical protein